MKPKKADTKIGYLGSSTMKYMYNDTRFSQMIKYKLVQTYFTVNLTFCDGAIYYWWKRKHFT